jgi:iron(III) transport system substrate-binding protein
MKRRPWKTWFMKNWLVVTVAMLAALTLGLAWFGPRIQQPSAQQPTTMTVLGTSSEVLLAPTIAAFAAKYPHIKVRYRELDGSAIYSTVLRDIATGTPGADIAFSTAMDLQVKLVNDGMTLAHASQNAAALPPWARWRNEAFGVTFEPVVMVFNRSVMASRAIPRSRAALLEAIAADPAFWRGRIGTFDPRRSGTGYLLLSQDYRQQSDAGALIKSFGDAHAYLDEDSNHMLDRLERGDLAVVYNCLSSYVRRRQARGAPLEAVFPQEFTLAILRTAVIPRNAAHPQAAHAFLEFLLSPEGQRTLSHDTGFNAIREDAVAGGADIAGSGMVRPVPLGPGLLVYLDQHKRRRLLQNWDALVDRPAP